VEAERETGGSVLRGAAGRGPEGRGQEGWAPHGAARRHGISAAVARPRRTVPARCRARVESGGVGAMRVDVADRWARARRGPSHQQLGAAWGSAVRRSARR
jgi:hypothetical protein